jgi:phage terminase small subunit
MPKHKKTPRQIIFVREYAKDFNGTRAAIAAGCPKRSAHVTASRWLKLAKVQEDIQRGINRVSAKLEISADRVLGELAKLAFSNMADYVEVSADGTARVDLSGLTRDQMAAIEQLETREYIENEKFEDDAQAGREVRKIKFKLSNKREALELLGKHLRLFQEEGANPLRVGVQVIVVDIPRPARPALAAPEVQVLEVKPANGNGGSNGHNGNGSGGHD